MSLTFLTGSSGAGKSYTVFREIIEASMAHPEKQYLILVPEQFTMQTQKELVRMHPRHGLLNVDGRLRSIYGEKYGLDIDTSECGTTVNLRIPPKALLEG